MPFQSKAQQRWMFSQHPAMAKRWADHTSDIKALPEHVKHKRPRKKGQHAHAEKMASLALQMGKKALFANQAHGPAPQQIQDGPRQQDAATGVAPPTSQPLTPQQPAPTPASPLQPQAGQTQLAAQPAPPPSQAQPGGFKPSPLLSVPHPPSPQGSRIAAIQQLFVPQAPPPPPSNPLTQKQARDLLGKALRASRLSLAPPAVKVAQIPGQAAPWGFNPTPPGGYPASAPGAYGYNGYGSTPYNTVPLYRGTQVQGHSTLGGQPYDKMYPSGPRGAGPYDKMYPSGQQGAGFYGAAHPSADPLYQLNHQKYILETNVAEGRITMDDYKRGIARLKQQRDAITSNRNMFDSAANEPALSGSPGLAPNPFGAGAAGSVPAPTWESVQAQRNKEMAIRTGLDSDLAGLQDRGAKLDRTQYDRGLDTVAKLKTVDPGLYQEFQGKWADHTARGMMPDWQTNQPAFEALKKKLITDNWALDEQKIPVDAMSHYGVDPARVAQAKQAYGAKYVDPAFRHMADNEAFRALQAKAQAGDPGAVEQLARMKQSMTMPDQLMKNPEFQMMWNDPAQREKAEALLNHVGNREQYKQQDAQWADTEKAWKAHNAGQSNGAGGMPAPGAAPATPPVAGATPAAPSIPAVPGPGSVAKDVYKPTTPAGSYGYNGARKATDPTPSEGAAKPMPGDEQAEIKPMPEQPGRPAGGLTTGSNNAPAIPDEESTAFTNPNNYMPTASMMGGAAGGRSRPDAADPRAGLDDAPLRRINELAQQAAAANRSGAGEPAPPPAASAPRSASSPVQSTPAVPAPLPATKPVTPSAGTAANTAPIKQTPLKPPTAPAKGLGN